MKEIAQHIAYRKALIFAMAKIRRIGHDHHAPFQDLVLVLVLFVISSGDARQKQAAT